MSEFQQLNFGLGAGSMRLQQREPREEWSCSCCGRSSIETATITSTALAPDGDESTFSGAVCGDCIAGGLAIMFGRAHVEAGGDVQDLDFDRLKKQRDGLGEGHVFTDSMCCKRCGRSRAALLEADEFVPCGGRPI